MNSRTVWWKFGAVVALLVSGVSCTRQGSDLPGAALPQATALGAEAALGSAVGPDGGSASDSSPASDASAGQETGPMEASSTNPLRKGEPGTSASLVPVGHSISKTEFCVGEPVTAKMETLSPDRTGDRINYVIGGIPGNEVALTFAKPGKYPVLFAASDGTAIDQQLIEVSVQDCGRSFEYVAVEAAPLAFQNDTFLYTAVVKVASPIGRDDQSEGFIEAKGVTYDWDFGDGTSETTSEPFAKHSYAQRDERSALQSTFITTVQARADGLRATVGKTTVSLQNVYKANLNNGRIVPKVLPARAVVARGGGYTARLEVNNLEPVALELSSAIVMPIACDGTDRGGTTVEVEDLLSSRQLPPGQSSIEIAIPEDVSAGDTCRMRYEIAGQTTDGRPVVLVAAVFVRDPPVASVDTSTPEFLERARLAETALRVLGRVDARGLVSGTISEAEIYELQLRGALDVPEPPLEPPLELPDGCAHCAAHQVCRKVSTYSTLGAYGHGSYAVKGDVAFLRNPTGEITSLIDALGETWTHTGIMVDGNNCRSDLMGGQAATPLKDLIDAQTTSALLQWAGQLTCSVGSPSVGDIKIKPAELYQGSPGVITEAMYDSSYFYPFGVTLAQPAGLATTAYSPRWTMQAAADTAKNISQRYGIYGYSDYTYAANQPGTYEILPKGSPSGHGGCSGFVMRALYDTAKTLPDFALNTYPASVRQNAAYAMYNSLYGDCASHGVSGFIYKALVAKKCNAQPWDCATGTLTACQINKLQNSCNGVGTGIAQWTEGLVNQVVNCFAFGDVGNGGTQVCTATNSTAWQSPGTGSGTISPDSVYNQMGTKYSATYVQEVLYPNIWLVHEVWGCVDRVDSVLKLAPTTEAVASSVPPVSTRERGEPGRPTPVTEP